VTAEARSVREQELLDLGCRRDRELVEGVVAGVGEFGQFGVEVLTAPGSQVLGKRRLV
jgi:hypothetical protein